LRLAPGDGPEARRAELIGHGAWTERAKELAGEAADEATHG
jgi:hypothetical protein